MLDTCENLFCFEELQESFYLKKIEEKSKGEIVNKLFLQVLDEMYLNPRFSASNCEKINYLEKKTTFFLFVWLILSFVLTWQYFHHHSSFSSL